MTVSNSNAVKGIRRFTEKMAWDPSYGSYQANFPVSNLTKLPLARVNRTTDAAERSTRWKGVADRERSILLMGLCRHTISLQGKKRIRLYKAAPLSVTMDAATNYVTATRHGLSHGQKVTLWSTDTLPAGLADGTVYYVHVIDLDTITLHVLFSDSLTGSNPIDVTDAGTGVHEMLRNLLFDSGYIDVWPVVYSWDSLEWEDDNWWSGKYLREDVQGRTWTRPYLFDKNYLFRTITVEVQDTNNTAGFIDLGLLELSTGWQFSVNFAEGAQFGFRFRSKAGESWGGVIEFEALEKPRTFRGTIDLLDMNEVMEQGHEALFRDDVTEPFLWMPHPDEPKHWLRNTYLARNIDPGPFAYVTKTGNYASVPLNHEEVL